MRRDYHKLVRDRIPEIIRQAGGTCATTVLDPVGYEQALRTKLVEEAQEAHDATALTLSTELADVLEVVAALAAAAGLTLEQVIAEQERRRAERGGFAQRLQLLWAT